MARPVGVFSDSDKLEEMLSRYRDGWSTIKLGREYGMDHTSILYWLRKVGAPVVTRRHRIYDPTSASQVIAEYAAGQTVSNIAYKFKTDEQIIYSVLRKNSVPLRARGRAIPVTRHMPPDPERRRPTKSYEQILADAAKRGSKAAAAHLGGRYNTE